MTSLNKRQVRNRWILALLIGLGYLFATTYFVNERKTPVAAAPKPAPAPTAAIETTVPSIDERSIDVATNLPYPLHQAIEAKDDSRVVQLLSEPEHLVTTDENGNSALHIAVSRVQLHVTAALLLMGADPVAQNNTGKIPLFLLPNSERYEGAEQFRRLLQDPVWQISISPRASVEELAQATFYIASRTGDPDLLAQSVAQGADIDRPLTPDGRTALHYVTSAQAVEKLVQIGSAVDVQDDNGDTPLMTAARAGNVRQVQALLTANASANVRDNNSRSALTLAIETGREGFPEIVTALLRQGAEVSSKEWTAAVSKREAKVLKALFDHGAAFSTETAEGQEILRQAQMRGGPEVRQALKVHPTIGPGLLHLKDQQDQQRQAGIESVARSISPHLGFFIVALSVLPIIVAFLVCQLITTSWRRWIISVGLSVAALYLLLLPIGVQRLVADMRFFGAPIAGAGLLISAVVIVIASCVAAVVIPVVIKLLRNDTVTRPARRLFRAWGASGALVLLFGVLLLHHTERIQFVDQFYLALTGTALDKPSVDVQSHRQTEPSKPAPRKTESTEPNSDWTWFDNISSNRVELVAAALGAGRDPDTKDRYGRTALHITVHQRNWTKLAALLLKHGADANAVDKDSRVPLCVALARDRFNKPNTQVITMTELLLANGAAIRHPQCAPAHMAENPATLQWLIDKGADLEGTIETKPTRRSAYGRVTGLWRAARDVDLAKVENLIALGADVNARDSAKGFSVLHIALADVRYRSEPRAETIAVVGALLAAGADTQVVAYDGTSVQSIDAHGLLKKHTAISRDQRR